MTKLPNSLLFYERVEHALSRGSRLRTDLSVPSPAIADLAVVDNIRSHEVSVLLIEMDDFKAVNDTLGHAGGDELLVQFAGRLLGCLRDEDTAARFGGDEFAVCIEVSAGQPGVTTAAQRLLDAMSEPFRIANTDVHARVSIGISTAGDATVGPLDMLREADLALYAAKHTGKGSFRFFEATLHPPVDPAPRNPRPQAEQAQPAPLPAEIDARNVTTNPAQLSTPAPLRRSPTGMDPEPQQSPYRRRRLRIPRVLPVGPHRRRRPTTPGPRHPTDVLHLPRRNTPSRSTQTLKSRRSGERDVRRAATASPPCDRRDRVPEEATRSHAPPPPFVRPWP